MKTLNSELELELNSDLDDQFSEEELTMWQAEQYFQQQQSFYSADFY
jgi:hypothetical protein